MTFGVVGVVRGFVGLRSGVCMAITRSILVVRHHWTESALVVLFGHETFMLISAKA